MNTQKTLVKLVGKQFTDWTYPSDLLPDTFAGLEHVSGPGDPGLSPKAAWRKPITLKHGPSGTEVFVNCYRRREEPAQPRDPNLPGTPYLPLTEPDYRYQSAEFHALKAAAAREKSRDVFVFLDGDILFKVELSGGSPELRLKLVRSTAEAIWKFRHREDVATIRGIFRPTKEEFFSDEPIMVEMVVHNDAVEDFRFDTGGDYRFGNGRHDRFFVTFGDPNAKYISIGGGLHGLGIVPAKGVYKEVIDLTPWSPPGPDDQGIIRVTCRRTLTTRVATKLLVDCLEKQPIDYTRKDARAVLIVKMTRLNQHRAGFADERDKQKEIERVVDSYMRFPQIQSTFECSVSGRVTSAEAATGTAEQRPGQPGRVSSEVASWLRDLRSDVPGKRLEAIRKLGNWNENGTDHSEALYGEDPAARRLAAARLDASGRQEITGALLDRLERNVENRTGYEDGSVSVTREGIHRTVRVESENEALANALRQLGVTRAVPLLKRAHSFQLERQPAEERPDTMPGTFAFCIYMLSMERVDVWENGKLKSFQPGPVLEEQARQLLRPDLKPTRGLTASLWVSSASRYPKFFVGDATLVAVLTVTNHSDQPIPADLSPETITFSCVDSGGQRVNIPATDMVKPVVGLAPQTLAPKGSATCTWHLKPLKDSALGRPMKRGYVSLKAVYAPRNETVRKQWGSGPLVSNTLTRPYFDNTRPDSPWHLLQKGNLVTVDVERALYEKPGEPHFFIRVRLTNVTDRPVGVDLRDYSKVVYPNQWGPANVDYRRAINERRRPHEPLDDAARAKLLADFRDGKLTVIPAGRAVDYYREFNGSGRADVDKQVAKYKYLIVSLDGALRLTDGTQVEQISCSWDRTDDSRTALVIATPVPWKTIPAGAEVKAASKEIAGGKPSAERTDSRTPLAMPRTVPVAEDVTIREGHRTRYVWRGAEWKPVELLDGWDQQRLWKALSEHVTAEATPRLSGCTFQTNENTFTVFCKSPEYETLKKPEGVDPAKVKTVGPVVGPDKDGLILRLQWQNDHTRHPKPRLFDRGPWRDLYAEVHLPTTSACIGVRVGYGPETDARLIQHLVAPSRWLRSIGAIAQRAPQPAGPKSQPSTTKNAPTTVRGSSPLARKLADSMLAGWGLTKSGHCHAPAEWSGKTDCEYLEFTHDTLKSSLDDISRAAFNVWLTPRDYAGRRLPTMDDQPGGAWLFGQSRDHLLFFEVPPDVPKETAIRLHSVWKVSRQNPQGIAAGWAGGDGLLRQ